MPPMLKKGFHLRNVTIERVNGLLSQVDGVTRERSGEENYGQKPETQAAKTH